MSRSKERDAFTCGFAVACANLCKDHGEDALAEFLLEDAGMDRARLRAAGVEAGDMASLKVALDAIADRARKGAA